MHINPGPNDYITILLLIKFNIKMFKKNNITILFNIVNNVLILQSMKYVWRH